MEVHVSAPGYIQGGYWNPEQMDLEFIKLPVKPLCSLVLSLSVYHFSGVAVDNVHNHNISFKDSFFTFHAYPLTTNPFSPMGCVSQGRHGQRNGVFIRPDLSEVCMYLHSSGSTGLPKVIPQSHKLNWAGSRTFKVLCLCTALTTL